MKNKTMAGMLLILSIYLVACSNQITKQNDMINTKNPVQQSESVNNTEHKITEDKAKEIALEHASVNSDQVTFMTSELEIEDGMEVYDIEFYVNNIEHNYKIDVNTGKIISYEKD